MPFLFGFVIFLVIVAAITFLIFRAARKQAATLRPQALAEAERSRYERDTDLIKKYDDARSAEWFFKVSTIGTLIFALFLTALGSFTIVPTREIGVVTQFGRPVDSLSNGLHAKAPWQKVSKLDGKIQTDNFTGKDDAISVRLGNGSTAKVDTTIRWRIKLEAGQDLYRDYRDLDSIRDSLVTRELKAALNEVLGDYDPLVSVKAGVKDDGKTESAGIDLNKFSAEVNEALKARVGDDVEILSVILPIIRFDDDTQDKINAFQAEVGNTRIAEQREATAKAQARANANLSGSVTKDPNVLVSKCLDALEEMVKKGQSVPIGFSCWPGGGGSSVVLPQK